MAIVSPVTTQTLKTVRETAALNTVMGRRVQDDCSVLYPTVISYETIEYQLDDAGGKTAVYDRIPGGEFQVAQEELVALWSIPMTLQDGTQTVLGELLAAEIDKLIAQRIAPPVEG